MARPTLSPVYSDVAVNKNFSVLREILCGGLSFDNLNVQIISGQTADTFDTASQIIHSMTPQPIGWFPLVGDVYVQSIDSKYVDVRSTKASVPFKIILLAGASLTGEAISAAGVTQAPIDDLAPTLVNSTACENAGKSTLPGSNYVNCLNDANYFYLTVGGIAAANGAELVRINKATGQSDSITCGSVALSAMCFQGTDLYVMPNVDTAGSINVFKIDTLTFTLTSTTAVASGNSPRVTDIFVDQTNIYFTCGTTGSQGAVIRRCTLAGAALTTLNLASTVNAGNSSGGKKIISDGTSLWVSEYDSASQATTNVYQVSLASFTLTSTTATLGACYRMANGVLLGTTIWYPAVSEQSGKTPTNVSYGTVLLEFNTVTKTFVVHPIAGMSNSSKGSADLCFVRNIVTVDDFIYLVQCSPNGEFGVRICEFDTEDFSQQTGWFPFACAFPAVEYALNNNIILDAATGELIVLNNTSGTSGSPNFEYFKPSFS